MMQWLVRQLKGCPNHNMWKGFDDLLQPQRRTAMGRIREFLERIGVIKQKPLSADEAAYRAIMLERQLFPKDESQPALHVLLRNGSEWDAKQWQQYEMFLQGNHELHEALRQVENNAREIAPRELNGPER
jgi:hypothetical protein